MKKQSPLVRAKRGAILVEAVSALGLMTPLFVLVIFVVMQASQAYVINASMAEAAAVAARALADYYQTNPEVVTNVAEQQAIFSTITIPGMVTGNSQFSIASGGWNLTSTPPKVTVTVSYLPGQGSPALAPYPVFDPLKLGSKFVISASSTYSLYE